MLKVEIKGLDRAIRDLKDFAGKAMPFAARDAVNDAAFQARRVWGDEIRKKLTTRNTYTAGKALVVAKAKGLRMSTMQATVGSIAGFMGLQEFGGSRTAKAHHLAIPGPVAAGQAAGAKRTKTIRAANQLAAIRVSAARLRGGRRQRNAIAIAVARKTGQKVALLLRPKGGLGLFAIGGEKGRLRTRLLYDLSRRSAHVRPHATLGPTVQEIGHRMPRIMLDAVTKQLKRHRVLGY